MNGKAAFNATIPCSYFWLRLKGLVFQQNKLKTTLKVKKVKLLDVSLTTDHSMYYSIGEPSNQYTARYFLNFVKTARASKVAIKTVSGLVLDKRSSSHFQSEETYTQDLDLAFQGQDIKLRTAPLFLSLDPQLLSDIYLLLNPLPRLDSSLSIFKSCCSMEQSFELTKQQEVTNQASYSFQLELPYLRARLSEHSLLEC